MGTDPAAIIAAVETLMDEPERWKEAARIVNPYGDGWASERIARVLALRFGLDPGPRPRGLAALADSPRSKKARSTAPSGMKTRVNGSKRMIWGIKCMPLTC